jgi:hypothetical protein
MTDWPFESLVFTGKSREEMLGASQTFYREIRKRRTVREFSSRPVAREIIENSLLAAGTSTRNSA